MKNIGTKQINTERLVLRKLEPNDYKIMYNSWCSDPEVTKFLPWETHSNMEETKQILNMWIDEYNDSYTFRWIIILKETNTPIGTIDVVSKSIDDNLVEVGYCYSKSSWGQGYATEALKSVIEYLFDEVKVDIVTAKYHAANTSSGKVMTSANMKYDATLRLRVIDKTTKKRDDLIYYSITKSEFNNSKK